MSIRLGSVEEARFRGEPALVLSSGDLIATFLPTLGMTGVSLRHRGVEYLALPGGLPALRRGATLGLPLLAPWANRLSKWRYRAAGVDVDLTGLPLGLDSNGLPIHGLLVGRPGWRVDRGSFSRGAARLEASIDIDAPAFPFPHRIDLAVAVRDSQLTVDTSVTPTGRRSVPVAFGWHPYMRLPDHDRKEWHLLLPSRTHLELDERGIPTGASKALRRESRPVRSRTFDDLYAFRRERRLAIVAEDGAFLILQCDSGYPFAQVWVPPGRHFVALEPMTAPTNSLVDGVAAVVAPGDTYRARYSIALGAPTEGTTSSTSEDVTAASVG